LTRRCTRCRLAVATTLRRYKTSFAAKKKKTGKKPNRCTHTHTHTKTDNKYKHVNSARGRRKPRKNRENKPPLPHTRTVPIVGGGEWRRACRGERTKKKSVRARVTNVIAIYICVRHSHRARGSVRRILYINIYTSMYLLCIRYRRVFVCFPRVVRVTSARRVQSIVVGRYVYVRARRRLVLSSRTRTRSSGIDNIS